MELTNEFEVAVPVAEAWSVLTDVERIAPCLPGAELKEVEGDEYRGLVKVKVGPITASYRGAAHFTELDEVAHRAVLQAEGRETRGQGNASATIVATLSASDLGTKVQVATELSITGKVAQFGRGVLADVSAKLLDQFVQNLETMVLAPAPDTAGEPDSGTNVQAAAGTQPQTKKKAPAQPKSEPAPEADSAPAAKSERTGDSEPDAGAEPETPPKAETPPKPEPKPRTRPKPKAAPAASNAAKLDDEVAGTPETEVPTPTVRQIHSAPAEPVDLIGMAGPSLARRVLPFASVAGVLLLARIVVYALRRRKS
jgi:uncharacterized protein